MDTRQANADARARIIELVRETEATGDEPVPCCPSWTVHDVIAHLAGSSDDLLAGRLDGVASDAWTEAQVAARRDRSLFELLDEMERLGPQVEEALGDQTPAQLVFDTVTHEHDLRGALGRPGARDSHAVEVGFRFGSNAWGLAVAAGALPAVLVRSDKGERVQGEGEPAATLTGTSYELLRSFSGRRSLDQVAALDWGGSDPTPWLPAFQHAVFAPPGSPVDPT